MGLENWIKALGRGAAEFAVRMGRETRGNVAMIFGLSLPVLVLMTVGGVDIHRASTVRVNLQDALDAAALAAARSPYDTTAQINTVGLAALRANLAAYPDITLRTADTTFVLNAQNIVVANAKVDVKTLVANIFLPPYGQFMDDYLPVGGHSEVNRSSKDLEVALVLDVTGSMAGAKLASLKAAAEELVDLVVQDTQTPYYSRMSIVPYSVGVNLASRANSARGTAIGARTITGASWSTGSAKSITGITRASPGVVTTSSHGLSTGDYVWIRDVDGMTQINNRAYRVVRISNSKFSLEAWNGSSWSAVNTTSSNGYSSYDDDGEVRVCRVSDCSVVVTANGHGLSNGDGVYISGVGGMTQINSKGYEVANVTTNTYSIGVNGAEWGSYSSGGSSWCGEYGCQWRVYRNPSNTLKWLQTGTCVSERTGAQAYTDAAPSGAKASFNYAAAANPCPAAGIQPLTSSKSTLTNLIDDLEAEGSTAGQIGAAWGWYTVSSNFNSLWSSNTAGAHDPVNLLKAVIIMTDGEFNAPYCSGVIARDAGNGGNDRIDCNATNGDPFDQTEALCNAMKADDIIVYTVGFQVAAGGDAARVLAACASGSDHYFQPSSGADLTEAFKAIGRDITRLRISK